MQKIRKTNTGEKENNCHRDGTPGRTRAGASGPGQGGPPLLCISWYLRISWKSVEYVIYIYMFGIFWYICNTLLFQQRTPQHTCALCKLQDGHWNEQTYIHSPKVRSPLVTSLSSMKCGTLGVAHAALHVVAVILLMVL